MKNPVIHSSYKYNVYVYIFGHCSWELTLLKGTLFPSTVQWTTGKMNKMYRMGGKGERPRAVKFIGWRTQDFYAGKFAK